jgi:hypothetical protein
MGTARPWGSFLLKLAQFPLISCTNRIYSWDKVKYQLQQYLIIYRSKALIAKALDVNSLQPNPAATVWILGGWGTQAKHGGSATPT